MSNSAFYPKADRTSQWFGDGNSIMPTIDKWLLHTAEVPGGFPGYDSGGKAPGTTYDPFVHKWRQHFRINGSARALLDPDGTPVRENRDNVHQTEISCYCDPKYAKSGKFVTDLDEQAIDDLGEFGAWLHAEWGTPLVLAPLWLPYPESYGNTNARMTSAEYDAFKGILGHQHASGNDHGDPGALNVQAILASAKAHTTPITDPAKPSKPAPKPPKETPVSKIASPVPGHGVTFAFGIRRASYAAGYHTGDDYAANTGASVVAVLSGNVVTNGYSSAYGNWITLRADNGRDYVYCHLSRIVRTGRVSAGTEIGKVGATGNVTGPHLHFEDRPRGGGYGQCRKPSWGTSAPSGGIGGGAGGGGGGLPSKPKPKTASRTYPKPKGKIVYDSLVKPGQQNSDSVWHVQVALNAVSLKGGRDIPLTGDYDALTVAEVKKFQAQKCNDPADGDLGPKQTRYLFDLAKINVTHKEKP